MSEYTVKTDSSIAIKGKNYVEREAQAKVIDDFSSGNLDNYTWQGKPSAAEDRGRLEANALAPLAAINTVKTLGPGNIFIGHTQHRDLQDKVYAGLIFNAKDLNNYHTIVANKDKGDIELIKVASGSPTVVDSISGGAGDNGTWYEAEIKWKGNGTDVELVVHAESGEELTSGSFTIEPIQDSGSPANKFGFCAGPGGRIDDLERQPIA